MVATLRCCENGRYNVVSRNICHIATFENVHHIAMLGNVRQNAMFGNVSHNEMYGIMFYFLDNDLYFP